MLKFRILLISTDFFTTAINYSKNMYTIMYSTVKVQTTCKKNVAKNFAQYKQISVKNIYCD